MIGDFKVNTIGPVHLFNAFIPLILKDRTKKVFAISSGASDPVMTLEPDIYQATAYSIIKAALVWLSPSSVPLTGRRESFSWQSALEQSTPAVYRLVCNHLADSSRAFCCRFNIYQHLNSDRGEGALAMAMFGKFKAYSPILNGPSPVDQSAKSVLALTYKATVDGGYAGKFMSLTEKLPYL